MFELSKKSLKHLEGVEPSLIDFIKECIKDSPHDFGIPESGGVRTPEHQHSLYLGGFSLCDGYNRKSKHQTGKAFDIYAYVNGKASWNTAYLTQIGQHIKKKAQDLNFPIVWGGDFKKFKDLPHYEMP
ncbi:MAG: M15 family metallopeptidase [Lutibacter sp.]|jgi:peptidoglycan L-alanyl-D-glutamate endopeptidase CwlK